MVVVEWWTFEGMSVVEFWGYGKGREGLKVELEIVWGKYEFIVCCSFIGLCALVCFL